jgi:uncharacterized protein (TIGR03663 family)
MLEKLKKIKPIHIFWLLLLIAIATRFWDLGNRMFHHDESIHAWMSWNLLTGKGYHYDAPYHGPFLYHLETLVFAIFGLGEFQARIAVATFGVLFIAALYWFIRPFAGKLATLLIVALAVVSPIFSYYSRFNIHDMYMIVFTLTMVMSLFQFARTKNKSYLMLFAGAAGLAWSTKLNFYFVLVPMIIYGIGYLFYAAWQKQKIEIGRFFKENVNTLWICLGIFIGIAAVLFTTTFAYYVSAQNQNFFQAMGTTISSSLLDGFKHWAEMHKIQRIKGPFHFYLPIIFVYEPLVLLGFLGAMFYYIKRKLLFWGVLTIFFALMALLVAFIPADSKFLTETLRMQPWHLVLALSAFFIGCWSTVSLWKAKKHFLAFWLFFGVIQFLLYSFAGEKVPWLATHILLPWTLVAGVFLVELGRSLKSKLAKSILIIVITIGLLFGFYSQMVVNIKNGVNAVEPMIQVQNTDDVAETIRIIKKLVPKDSNNVQVTIHNPIAWPFCWYLRDWKITYPASISGKETTDIIITDSTDPGKADLEKNYVRKKMNLNNWSWWITKIDQGDFAGMLRFMIFHDKWGDPGWVYYYLWIKKDLAGQIGW